MINSSDIEFVLPKLLSSAEISSFIRCFTDVGEHTINGSCGLLKFESILEWQAYVERVSKGKEPERIRSDVYFVKLHNDSRIIGITDIRHYLSDKHRQNGHIGSSVTPSERRKGYGIAILRKSLELAHSLGIDPAIVSCDEDNVKSKSVLERYGEFCERIVEENGNIILCYKFSALSIGEI